MPIVDCVSRHGSFVHAVQKSLFRPKTAAGVHNSWMGVIEIVK